MRAKLFSILAVSFLSVAGAATFFAYRDSSFRLDSKIDSVMDVETANGLRDLTPVSDFLSDEWRRSPASFDRAFGRFFQMAESRKIPIGSDSVLRMFEISHPDFCVGLDVAKLSEKLGTYCEWKTRPLADMPKIAPSDWKVPDCDGYSKSKNRQKCLKAVSMVLSKFSDSHCSDSSCKNDQAAFVALVAPKADPASVCSSRPSVPLRKECETFVSEVLSPAARPVGEAELESRLRSAISGKATDSVSSAVRRAAFSEESSPSEECASVPVDEIPGCETLAKAALDYAERERLKSRIARIRAAATEEKGRTEK